MTRGETLHFESEGQLTMTDALDKHTWHHVTGEPAPDEVRGDTP